MLSSFLDTVESLYISKLPGNKSGVSGEQSLPQSPGSAPASNTQSSDVVQGDHSSSPQQGWPAPERSVRGNTEGDASINPEPWMGQESMDVAVQPSTSFPVAVNVDAGPQPLPEATTQPALPEVVLPGEGNQLLENKGAPLQTGQQLSKAAHAVPSSIYTSPRRDDSITAPARSSSPSSIIQNKFGPELLRGFPVVCSSLPAAAKHRVQPQGLTLSQTPF
ncbi:hypothetical protein Anapl_17789 [Anas platyrhynchos]|uniref:Uncharacterized protein n=1 Tax=Anas platyrhynchos TaxID=8839 RepID=R0JSF0_ANAPL|nr:hypothetical protein Anapl_17789 [Anas platyrhynchos]